MKRIFLFALLIFATLALPVTAVRAQTMSPGCNPQMWQYLEDQATATRARNKAYEREIINRQPSTLYLTCFDQSMALSAKLGLFFSDLVSNPGPPPADMLVMPAVAYPNWGAAQPTLAMRLNAVVNPEFDNWLDAVAPWPAMFNFLPQWVPTTNNKLAPLAATEAAVIAAIAAFQATDAGTAQTEYMAQLTTTNVLVQSLPTVPLQMLIPDVPQYTTYVTILSTLVASIEAARVSAMTPLLATLTQAINGFTIECSRTDDLWDGYNTDLPHVWDTNSQDPSYVLNQPGVFYPPESVIYYPFTPYYTLQDFLNVQQMTSQGTPPTAPETPDFAQELGDATDSQALKQALTDLNNLTNEAQAPPPPGAAGQSAIWPAPPTFASQSPSQPLTAQDVINQM